MTVYDKHLTQVWPVATPLSPEQSENGDFIVWEPEVEGYTSGLMNPIQQRMIVILVFVVAGALLFATLALPRIQGQLNSNGRAANTGAATNSGMTVSGSSITGGISPLFTAEVKYWEPQILAWAQQYNLDPNMVATVMQIESCGDPQALSIAGAQGLFQVMPFHFQPGENAFDPDTNARRGMSFLADLLLQFEEPNLAFAGYNGGPGNAVKNWSQWPAEMQRYYRWASGIYADAAAGLDRSETLDTWLAAGGAHGCARAAANLGLE